MVLEKSESEERDELAQGLTWLAVIGTVSPLMGLLGTVIGIMNTFLGITAAGSTNISAVAPGIAEALITTVAGLSVAIPAVLAYNYFVGKLTLVTSELEGFSSEFIGTLAREGRLCDAHGAGGWQTFPSPPTSTSPAWWTWRSCCSSSSS